jgi:NAD(P)-dependent dehydrogenase (short-subunit alcohol dehydrogenase family)
MMMHSAARYPDLEGRVAAVTGGSRGFGRAMALAFAANGAHVIIGSIAPAESEGVARQIREQGGSALARQLDVRSRDQCEAFSQHAVDRFGALDIMICNAGIGPAASVADISPEIWQRTIDVNLTGAFNTSVTAAKRMISAGKGGSIVFVSSNAAQVGFSGLAAYGAAKAGINQLVRSLAMEFGPQGIRANAIAPGWTNHRMEGNEGTIDHQIMAEGIARTPLRRVGEVEEIAGAAVFLASEAASFISGVVLTVDGGYTAV